jgi:hypothetical protein
LTFLLNVKRLDCLCCMLNNLTFVFEQIDWTDFCVDHLMTCLLCCLSKSIEWTDFCVVWAKWLNIFDCFVERNMTGLFVLYIKWLVFCVVWASRLNGLTFLLFEQNDWIDLTVLLNVIWLDILCCTLNDLTFGFEQIDWTDFCVEH